jgi:hypothetical protein
MPAGIGCIIRYSIDLVSNPGFAPYLDQMSVKQAVSMDVDVLSGQGFESGEFITSAVIVDDNHRSAIVAVGGTYSMEPDYKLMRRIARWRCGFSPGEAVTREDFAEAYGQMRGGHFYEKWVSFDRKIEPMTDYFGDNFKHGQAFIGMVMKRVYQFEKRLKEGKK